MNTMQTMASTSASISMIIKNSKYPKGFKFILPRLFKGEQNELEPWLFNMEEYFQNMTLPINKWIRVVVSNMNRNATL